MRRVGYNELIFENMVYLVKYPFSFLHFIRDVMGEKERERKREREREREKHNVIFVSKKCHCILYLCAQRHNTRDLGVDRVTFRDNQFRRI